MALSAASPSYPPERFCFLRWDVEGAPPFGNGLIFLDLAALRPTRLTLAHLYGVAPRDAAAIAVTTPEGAAVPLADPAAPDPSFCLERGARYRVRLSSAEAAARAASRTRIQDLLGLLGEARVRALSNAFYATVFAPAPPPQPDATSDAEEQRAHSAFRVLFAAAADNATAAARSQADWFIELWGGGLRRGGPTPYSDHAFGGPATSTAGEADNGRQAAGAVVRKHPAAIMAPRHAARWLGYMGLAINSSIADADARSDLRAYMLHFLAFFEMPRPPLCEAVGAPRQRAARL